MTRNNRFVGTREEEGEGERGGESGREGEGGEGGGEREGRREGGREEGRGIRNQIIYLNCWCGHIKWD